MVFHAMTLVMRVQNRKRTAQALKELGVAVFNNGGIIRKFTNEGVFRPYARYRDINNVPLTVARYVSLQLDMPEDSFKDLMKMVREHPDFYISALHNTERPIGMANQPEFFPLDTFTRLEEEINWPPQVSADAYEQMEMNWKEFSRTRWSNYLRK